jgi:PIN domain nuclease of toxin-antitoxin system
MGKKYLLDTHCLIWFQDSTPKIPFHILEKIKNPINEIFFSLINLLEIAIKLKTGKRISGKATVIEIYHQAFKDDFTFIPISNQHIYSYQRIPLLEEHRDPFDRLLVATAYEEDLIILSNDEKFLLYPEIVKCLW